MKRAQGGILADGFNSMLAAVFNSFPNSIFAQNNGMIQLTGVASRYVGYFIAGALFLLGLFPVVGQFFSLIPDCVLGGATLLMFGTVAASGIRIIAATDINRKAVLVMAISFAMGMSVEFHLFVRYLNGWNNSNHCKRPDKSKGEINFYYLDFTVVAVEDRN